MTGTNAPLIGRALAVYDVICDESGAPVWIDLVYLKKGTFTTVLAESPLDTQVTLWGPLGNGFADRSCDRLIMVAGGIGQTPMLLLGKEAMGTQNFGDDKRQHGWSRNVELIYGARRASLLAGVEDFEKAGFGVTYAQTMAQPVNKDSFQMAGNVWRMADSGRQPRCNLWTRNRWKRYRSLPGAGIDANQHGNPWLAVSALLFMRCPVRRMAPKNGTTNELASRVNLDADQICW